MSQQIVKPEIPKQVEEQQTQQQAEAQTKQQAEEQTQQQAEQASQKPEAPKSDEIEFNFKFQPYEEIVRQIESTAYVAKLKREFAEMDDNADKIYTIQEVRYDGFHLTKTKISLVII